MSEPKTYSLKSAEIEVLATTQAQMNTVISNIISMIALERLAYNVTDNTMFQFSKDMKEVTISEVEAVADVPEVITEAPKKGKK